MLIYQPDSPTYFHTLIYQPDYLTYFHSFNHFHFIFSSSFSSSFSSPFRFCFHPPSFSVLSDWRPTLRSLLWSHQPLLTGWTCLRARPAYFLSRLPSFPSYLFTYDPIIPESLPSVQYSVAFYCLATGFINRDYLQEVLCITCTCNLMSACSVYAIPHARFVRNARSLWTHSPNSAV